MPKRSSKHLSFLYLTAQQKVVHLHTFLAFQLDFLQAQHSIAGLDKDFLLRHLAILPGIE